MLFTNVLFPVDFSERSAAIVPHVRAVCARFKASLTLLHLVEMPFMAYGSPEAPAVFDFPMAAVREAAEKKLALFAAAQFPGEAVKTAVDEGDPGSRIPVLAALWKVDLIMMPTRGHGPFRAALLGSAAAKTLHDAACAVWTEAHCAEPGAENLEWRSILCAIDTAPEGLRLIRFAAELAANSGAVVRLVHVVPAAEAGIEKYLDLEFVTVLADQARRAIDVMQKEAGTAFEVCIGKGNIPEAVRQEAVNRDAGLVLIGRGSLPHFAGRLRSHAAAIVRHMPCPVLSV